MHIHKSPLHKEAVDGVGDEGAHPEYRLERVGPGAQVGYGAQILKGMALLLQRIVRRGGSLHCGLRGLHLKGLLCARRLHDGALYDQGRPHIDPAQRIKIRQGMPVHYLQRLKKGSVIYDQKSEILGVPVASHPPADGHLFANVLPASAVKVFNVCQFHIFLISARLLPARCFY